MPRRRNLLRTGVPHGKCEICGNNAIPPMAAHYCEKHMPTEVQCPKCGRKYKWQYKGRGICPACWYPFMKKLQEESPNAICWQYTDFKILKDEARRFKG